SPGSCVPCATIFFYFPETSTTDIYTLSLHDALPIFCYQVPAMAREGLCIVVSPLVALIHDQVAQLKARGIKAIALGGGISAGELGHLLDNCLYGNYKFLYLSPERLQQPMVQERIQGMNVNLLA